MCVHDGAVSLKELLLIHFYRNPGELYRPDSLAIGFPRMLKSQTYPYMEKMKKATMSHPMNEWTHQIDVTAIQIVPKIQRYPA